MRGAFLDSMNPDFAEILSALSAAGAEYIIVGAAATRERPAISTFGFVLHENAERVLHALRAFGAPLFDLTIDDLVDEQTMFQIGVAPVRIDILAGIDGRHRNGTPYPTKPT
jgi:hypothetical protein